MEIVAQAEYPQVFDVNVAESLARHFSDDEVRQRVGSRGMSFSYVTARAVQERLDEVVGPGGWETAYRVIDINGGAVECTLTVLGISKVDVGYPNKDMNDQEPLKAAYSDALKRAAVAFGVGRYLYGDSLPQGNQSVAPRPIQQNNYQNGAQQQSRPQQGSAPTTGSSNLASEAQVKAMFAIARGQQGMDNAALIERVIQIYGKKPEELTKRQASEMIDTLKGTDSQ